MGRKVANAIKVVSLVVMFAAFAFGMSFYHRDLPHTPVPEDGRIYLVNNHGHLLYMTHREKVQQQASFIIFGVLAVICVVSECVLGPNKGEESQPKNMQPWNHRWGP